MAKRDLVNGVKATLLKEFNEFYVVHGRKWRRLLKEHNNWHATDKGLRAWENVSRGTVGNEALRLILEDMRAIANGAASPPTTLQRRQGLVRKEAKDPDNKYPLATKALADAKKRRSALSKKTNR